MPFLQVVTDAIANPKQVRLSQERASTRKFSGLEAKMKAVRDTSPECMPGVVGPAIHRTASSFSSIAPSKQSSREPSRAPSRDVSVPTTPVVRPTAYLQRSQSELPIKSPRIQPKQEFTPDITAMDLTSDQIKRNYSCDDLLKWDRSKFPLPPMYPMTGFGRYRRAENADPEWCYHHLKKQIKDIERLPLGQLDMQSTTGYNTELWQALTDVTLRRDSVISSLSTATDSSAGQLDNGTRILRGFSPSGSSTRSSLTGHAHTRKGSTLSMMSLPTDTDSNSLPCTLQRTSTGPSERRASGPLTTIEELQTNTSTAAEVYRKIEKPCEFTESGDPDSAVASDAEDEDGWTDITETIPTKVSAITQMLNEEKNPDTQPHPHSQLGLVRVRTTSSDKKRARGSTVTLDRNKTFRALRPDIKRRQSKPPTTHDKGKSEPKIQAQFAEEFPDESLQSSAGLELYIPDRRKTQNNTESAKEPSLEASSKADARLDGSKKSDIQRHNTAKPAPKNLIYPKLSTEPAGQRTHVAYAAE